MQKKVTVPDCLKVIGLQSATLFENGLRHWRFPKNFAKFQTRFALGMSVFLNLDVVKFLSYHKRMKKTAYKSIHTKIENSICIGKHKVMLLRLFF